jgi:hypothetical protein
MPTFDTICYDAYKLCDGKLLAPLDLADVFWNRFFCLVTLL